MLRKFRQFPRQYFPDAAPHVEEVSDFDIEELREAVKRQKLGKAVGPDGIPSEFWKNMGNIGLEWVLMAKLKRGDPMPYQWRESILIPMYKGKGDTRFCDNYRRHSEPEDTNGKTSGFLKAVYIVS